MNPHERKQHLCLSIVQTKEQNKIVVLNAKSTLEPFEELPFVSFGFFVAEDFVSFFEGPGFTSDLGFGITSDFIFGLVSDLTFTALSAVFPLPFLDLLLLFFTKDFEDFAILLELLTSRLEMFQTNLCGFSIFISRILNPDIYFINMGLLI